MYELYIYGYIYVYIMEYCVNKPLYWTFINIVTIEFSVGFDWVRIQ